MLSLIMVVCALGFTLTACNTSEEPVHEHDFSIVKSNEQFHWFKCDCGETSNKEAHFGGTATTTEKAKCSVCNTEYGELAEEGENPGPSHTHKYTILKYNKTYHWYDCECGASSNLTKHSGGTATATQKARCSVCFAEYGELQSGHTHNHNQLKKDDDYHWYECSCGDANPKIAHSDNNIDGSCDTCGAKVEVEVPGLSPAPTTPQTPVIPNHPTSGDSSFLGQTPEQIYNSALKQLLGTGNYTFNAHHDIAMGMINSGYYMYVGDQTLDATYKYANNEYDGKEVVVVDMTALGQPAPETTIAQVVCANNMSYIMLQQPGQTSKLKDEGDFYDLQNATNIPLEITDNRLYCPSSQALENAYFNMSSDGATLTVRLSGAEAEQFIEGMHHGTDFQFSEIVFIVHFDSNGNILKINYLFQIYAPYYDYTFCYDYVCTVTVTDIGKTVVTAPIDADSYVYEDFIVKEEF